MGMVIAFSLASVAMLALLISSAILIRLFHKIDNQQQANRLKLKLLLLTPLSWLMVYAFPTQYDAARNNYDQLIMVWCTKTALFILMPAFIATVCRYIDSKSK
ncbi:hypothetical protein [Shewanella waksmanii]|uniref:hypothetical protein n=1 Tax=Shewanella waksmanii TaxID=213783 RepID=UPI00373559AA